MKKVSEFLQETNKKISKATVHNYIKEFELGEKSESGKVFLSDIDSQLIEKIYELSEDGNGKNTIRKKLELDKPKTEIKQVLESNKTEIRQEQDSLEQVLDTVSTSLIHFQDNLTNSLNDKLSIMSDVAEKYSQVAYRLGATEQENKYLLSSVQDKTESIHDLELKLTELKTSSENIIDSLRRELDKKDLIIQNLTDENLKIKTDLKEVTEKLNLEKSKTFWEKLKG